MRNQHAVLIFSVSESDKLHHLLDRHYSVSHVSVVSTLEDALRALRKRSFSLLIVTEDKVTDDVTDLLSEIVRENYSTATMLLMEKTEPAHIVHAAKLGITGFSRIGERPITIFQGVQQMFINGSYIHPEIAPALLKGMTNSQALQEVSANLTKREIDILIYIAKGCSGNEISGLLNISSHTVSSHIKNIYRKLDIHSKGEAVVEAIRLGLVDVGGSKAS